MRAGATLSTAERALPTIVVVGLGPADEDHLTAAAREVLEHSSAVYLRTERHPSAAFLLARGAHAFDRHYLEATSFEETYALIVEELVAAATAAGRIVYAVPGSPLVLESTVAALFADARVHCEVVPGMSFLDLCWARLRIDPVAAGVRLCDGQDFAVVAARDPGPLLVTQLWNTELLSAMKLALEAEPDGRAVFLHHLGLADEYVGEVTWSELDRSLEPDHLTSVYVPHLTSPVGAELARLESVVERLRAECPWDKVQTHRSLVRHLLEETYEVIEAIDELEAASDELEAASDDESLLAGEHLEEELGDLLCQVVFHSLLARETGLFDLADVARTIHDKLVRRHPHVFGDPGTRRDAQSVLSRWEEQKQTEKGRESLMDGIPAALPALLYVTKLERKANGVELGARTLETSSPRALADALERLVAGDLGDVGLLLFAVARFAADGGLDPEDALRLEAERFRRAFIAAEQVASASGARFATLAVEDKLELFQRAYASTSPPPGP